MKLQSTVARIVTALRRFRSPEVRSHPELLENRRASHQPSYCFRLRFNLPEVFRIRSEEPEIDLLTLPSGPTLKLKSGGADAPIKDYPRAAIVGKGFQTEADARAAAERAKRALLYCLIEARMGIDFGDGKQRSVVTKAGLETLEKENGVPFRNDIHGIDIYEEAPKMRFVHSSAQVQVGKDPIQFVGRFVQEYGKGRNVTDKQVLAAEIYGTSWFDITPRSRFITLVTAVEALLEPMRIHDSAIGLIDQFLEQVQSSGMPVAVVNSMRGSIERLKTQSIGQSGRALAERLLPDQSFGGRSAGAFFSYSYDVRSKVLHHGHTPDGVDIDQLVTHTEDFVAKLLIASLSNEENDG